jgi:hypothetical protein
MPTFLRRGPDAILIPLTMRLATHDYVLLTRAAGFIGRDRVAQLRDRRHSV